MEFEWDENKNQRNQAKHRINFEEAALIFRGATATKIDDREDYGEVREISMGLLGDQVVIVVMHTDREGVTRIISARTAKREERKAYYDYCKTLFG